MDSIYGGYYYEVMGDGPPLVYLPGTGWPGSQGLFLADRLIDTFQTYMLDLPGIGRSEGIQGRVNAKSMAEWVKHFLDERNIEQAVLVGHSLGGAITISFALMYPDRVKQLILLDIGHMKVARFPSQMFGTVGYMMPLISLYERIIGPGRDKKGVTRFQERSESQIDADINHKMKKVHFGLKDKGYLRTAMAIEPEAINSGLNLLLALYRLNLPKMLQAVTVDCTVVYGTYKGISDKDELRVSKAIEKLRQYRPDIQFFPVDSGHYPQWANERAAERICDMLH